MKGSFRGRTTRLMGGLLLCLSLLASGTASQADEGPWPDRDRPTGPLAIRKIAIGHAGYETTLDITFEKPVYPGRLGNGDFFVVDFDGRSGPKSDLWLYFVAGKAKWQVFDVKAMSLSRIKRISPTTFRIRIDHHASWYYYEPGGYRFRIASFSRTGPKCRSGCWDFVPQGSWLVHDWTKPEIPRFHTPYVWMEPGKEAAAPVRWRAIDRGYSGLLESALWTRTLGQEDWVKVASSKSTDLQTDTLQLSQGEVLDVTVTATDGARNQTRSPLLRTVSPFDEKNTALAATFLGLWEERPHPDAHYGGIHVSQTDLDSFSFTGVGSKFCIAFRTGAEFGRARLEVDGHLSWAEMSRVVYPSIANYHCADLRDAPKERTAVVSVSEGTINIDGFWVE